MSQAERQTICICFFSNLLTFCGRKVKKNIWTEQKKSPYRILADTEIIFFIPIKEIILLLAGSLLYLLHKQDKPNLPVYLRKMFPEQFRFLDHQFLGHKPNRILCKCTFS